MKSPQMQVEVPWGVICVLSVLFGTAATISGLWYFKGVILLMYDM
jgi:hypothetical protein